MKITRLPAFENDDSWSIELRDNQARNETLILLPGDTLLSERVTLPTLAQSTRQVKQWLQTNPDVSQWDPETEEIVWLTIEENACFYWAVKKKIWTFWSKIISEHDGVLAVIPDWMILPPPVHGEVFAMHIHNIVLCRYDNYCGSVTPEGMKDLVNHLSPRWLTLSDKNGNYPLTAGFIRHQCKEHKNMLSLKRWRAREYTDAIQAYIFVGIMAFCTYQAGIYTWLKSTREQPHMSHISVVKQHEQSHAFSKAMDLLISLQLQGPLKLQKLELHSGLIRISASSTIPCNVWRERLGTSDQNVQLDERPDTCLLRVAGKAK